MSDVRERFVNNYTVRFPLRAIQHQNGSFYGETQEHYETWLAATSDAKALVGELVEVMEGVKKAVDSEFGKGTAEANFEGMAEALTKATAWLEGK